MKDFHDLTPNLQKTYKAVVSLISRFDFQIRLFLLPILLLCVFAMLSIWLIHLQLHISSLTFFKKPLPDTLSEYPVFTDSFSPSLSASTAIVLDTQSQTILYQKNAIIQSSLASTTKVMTALTALEYFHPTDVLTVKRDAVDGSGLHLFSGEQFTFENLLYAMFLPSANDAAMAIADNYPGGEKEFVSAMKAKAVSLHLYHTSFQDPAGLEDNGDFATAGDLARMGEVALQNSLIRQIVGTGEKHITTIDGQNGYDLTNLNQLLGYDGVIGIKTGTTEGAGQVLLTAKKDQQNHLFIIVVMDSSDRYADTWGLLHLIDEHTRFLTPKQLISSVE